MDHFYPRLVPSVPLSTILILSFLILGPNISANADAVHLKRGGSLEGEVIEGENTVEVRLEGGSTTFSRDEVERIERTDPAAGTKSPILRTASDWSKKTSVWFNRTRLQAVKHWNNLQKKASSMMQPVGKSPATKLKEKKLNDSMLEMQRAQKKLHAQEKAAAQAKRALKKDGFNIS